MLVKTFKPQFLKDNKGQARLPGLAERHCGQALVGTLAIVAIASALVASIVLNSLINAESSLRFRQSNTVLNLAETALQNAIIKLERDPDYTGESLTLNDNRVIIEITGSNPKIVSVRSLNSSSEILRKLEAQVSFDSNGAISVNNWREL